MVKVLVTGSSGIVGYGILRCLKNECYLVGTTIYKNSPANCFSNKVKLVPRTGEPHYIDSLITLLQTENIDIAIPGIESDVECWNSHRLIIERTGAFPLLNNSKLINLCLDKWEFYLELEKNGVEERIPTSLCKDYEVYNYPIILKPRRGMGSRGIVKIENQNQFNEYSSKIGSTLMVQQYIGNDLDEYTVGAFFDYDSKLSACIMMRRLLSPLGYTTESEVVDSKDIVPVLEKLGDIFKPVGPTNFQFRRDKSKWKLLEINPRISSSTSIRKAFGYNEAQMAVDYFIKGKKISQPKLLYGKAIRYVEDYIIYDSNNIRYSREL